MLDHNLSARPPKQDEAPKRSDLFLGIALIGIPLLVIGFWIVVVIHFVVKHW